MDPKTDYILQMIEKIGGPLLASMSDVAARKDQPIETQAQKIAELLGSTVQMSIALGDIIDIGKISPEEAETLRVALAALAAPIVADQYRLLEKNPAQNQLQSIAGALETVMTFSDNFTLSPEAIERLKSLEGQSGPVHDTHQSLLMYLSGFVPVVDSIAAYSFGLPEKKMIQDVSNKISERAKALSSSIAGADNADLQKSISGPIIKVLGTLYSACHTEEMKTITAMDDPDQKAIDGALAKLWDRFDLKVSMLESVISHMRPDSRPDSAPAPEQSAAPAPAQNTIQTPQSPTGQTGAPDAPPAPPSPPPESGEPATGGHDETGAKKPAIFQSPQSASTSDPSSPETSATPDNQSPPQSAPDAPSSQGAPPSPPSTGGGGGPMGFFAKPGGASSPPPTSSEGEAAPQVAQQTTAVPEDPPQNTPPPDHSNPANTATSANPAKPAIFSQKPQPSTQDPDGAPDPGVNPPADDEKKDDQSGGSQQSGGGGSPMSFFKKGDDE